MYALVLVTWSVPEKDELFEFFEKINASGVLTLGSFSPTPTPFIQPGENTCVFKILLSNLVESHFGES